MAKKKHRKKPAAPAGRERKPKEQFEIRKGALQGWDYAILGVGALMMLAAFVLSLLSQTFPHKQAVVFLLMGVGCGVVAFFQNKTIKVKRTGGRTSLFWILTLLCILYLAAGVYAFVAL